MLDFKTTFASAMGSSMPSSSLIRFGIFELDLRSGELRRQGLKIRLEGQPVQVLMCLLDNPGNLVTREELHGKLWPADTFVNFEHGLNVAVKRLRQALNDSAANPRFVETLPKRGYRFIAPVQTITPAVNEVAPVAEELATGDPAETNDYDAVDPSASAPAVAPGRRSRASKWKLAGFALIVLLGVSAAWVFHTGTRRPQVIRSLAVLPLENLSGDASQDYFSDGMTDELITELGQIGELRVISRTSAMTYKGARKSLPAIARDLNVDAVVEGAVLRSGKQVRITAQLILAAADKHLWARSYEGELKDTFALQKQVARSIAEEIRIELTPHERAVLKNGRHVNPEAYEAYLKGRYFWNKRTGPGIKEAIGYFNLAIEKDPDYAEAYAGLADAYALAGDWKYGILSPRDAYPKARAAATKALELDSNLGDAHISLAFCLDNFDWDWEAAGREFQRGIELSPGYATGYEWYGWHLALLERNNEAVVEVEKAASLDPLSLIVSTDLAEELLVARRYDRAIKQSRKTMSLDPFFAPAHFVLGEVFVQNRTNGDAIAEFEKAVELSPGNMAYTANLAYAYAVSGMRDKAVTILNELKTLSQNGFSNAPEIALVYAGLGGKGQAMDWLDKAYSERFSPWVLMRPAFDPLLPEPRFQDLLRRLGLRR
jgi:TolB-like protein/DNA-binding winged helix-turn-helix (wHTH) protein